MLWYVAGVLEIGCLMGRGHGILWGEKFYRGKNMEKYEYKTLTYDTKGFWGGSVDTN